MMNELRCKSAKLLPQHLLLLEMREIFHSGIHEIMAVSFILLLIATVFTLFQLQTAK